MPHLAADPVVAAASIVMALQTVVSRNIDPQQTAIVTVGAPHAGSANNVIPQTATLALSVRALDPDMRDRLQHRITALVHAQAAGFGVSARVDYQRDCPVLDNSPAETAFARQVAVDLLGAGKVTLQGQALTGSEDFAVMLQHCPGSYLLIGNGTDDGPGGHGCMVHHPGHDFNDHSIAIGAACWVLLGAAGCCWRNRSSPSPALPADPADPP